MTATIDDTNIVDTDIVDTDTTEVAPRRTYTVTMKVWDLRRFDSLNDPDAIVRFLVYATTSQEAREIASDTDLEHRYEWLDSRCSTAKVGAKALKDQAPGVWLSVRGSEE